METNIQAAAFSGLIDLAAEKVGGRALIASDEFFASKDNLLKPGRGVFIPDKYTENGKWMDGWESRRKRTPGYDWCIIRLGLSGIIEGVDIDTNHFLGNNPAYASIEASCLTDKDGHLDEKTVWTEILSKCPLKPGMQNLFGIQAREKWTHLRLNIYPDGGVARLKVYGKVVPDLSRFKSGQLLDLAAIENGGAAIACSDMFFSSKDNLIMPGRGSNMADGWETKRRRGPGHDWVILKLAKAGRIQKLEIDTNHFKGNYPDTCSVDACYVMNKEVDALNWVDCDWQEVLPRTKLEANKQHHFEHELRHPGVMTHVRLNIYPDGGVSRMRVWGLLGESK